MSNRRKFDILAKFDYQFKRNNITLCFGKEPIKKLEHFRKGETITFRLKELTEPTKNNKPKKSSVKVRYKHAGTVTIEQSDSGIEPYKHQEEAFYNLQKEIIKSNKNPFAGLLVLPTGGGKTLTAAHWISKNIFDSEGYDSLETEARNRKIGIWNEPYPQHLRIGENRKLFTLYNHS